MISHLKSMGIDGIEGYPVSVECFISNGLPAFEVVGLPDVSVKEARERVRAAIKTSGLRFPPSRITVNLAPANTKKSGTLYDLPILLGILAAQGMIRLPDEQSAFLGELSLEGKLRPIPGVLPMAIAAVKAGIHTLYVPMQNAPEATLAEGLTVIPVRSSGFGLLPSCLLILRALRRLRPSRNGSARKRRARLWTSRTSWGRRMRSGRWRLPPRAVIIS